MPSGEGAFDLDFVEHIGHAGQHVGQAQQLLALVHEHGHPLAVADELQQLRGDEGQGFGVVLEQATGVALLGHHAGLVEDEFVEVFGGEVHGGRSGGRLTPSPSPKRRGGLILVFRGWFSKAS